MMPLDSKVHLLSYGTEVPDRRCSINKKDFDKLLFSKTQYFLDTYL